MSKNLKSVTYVVLHQKVLPMLCYLSRSD